LKALALFHLQIRQDKRAALPLLEKLAQVAEPRFMQLPRIVANQIALIAPSPDSSRASLQIPEHNSWAAQLLEP
jgi:hypothetical protein